MNISEKFAPLLGLALALLAASATAAADVALDSILAGPQRSAENRARDRYRHPSETLDFFGIRADMTVVEISPGTGWYSEILAPYLRDHGKLYAAHYSPTAEVEYFRKAVGDFKVKLAATPAIYDRVILTEFMPPDTLNIAPAGSADAVLTFRNVHNWLKDSGEVKVFKAAFTALKPGGVLGVVEHRAKPGTTREQSLASGYTSEQLVIEAAQAAGFVVDGKSEVNANARDTKDYPKGVWTLPPRLILGEQDKDRYLAIGESDRMTLRFRKPAQ